MTAASSALGVRSGWFASPTAVLVATGPQGAQHTDLVRAAPGDLDLARLAEVDALSADVASGRVGAEEALGRLARIEDSASPWPDAATWVAFGIASASLARSRSPGAARTRSRSWAGPDGGQNGL